LLFGLPLAAGFLPGSLAGGVTRFVPAAAGQAVAAWPARPGPAEP
jgi:hypothetical protein